MHTDGFIKCFLLYYDTVNNPMLLSLLYWNPNTLLTIYVNVILTIKRRNVSFQYSGSIFCAHLPMCSLFLKDSDRPKSNPPFSDPFFPPVPPRVWGAGSLLWPPRFWMRHRGRLKEISKIWGAKILVSWK